MRKFDEIQREKLARYLETRTFPELIAELFKLVPHPRAFLIEEICAFASNEEVRAMLESFGAFEVRGPEVVAESVAVDSMKHDGHLGSLEV